MSQPAEAGCCPDGYRALSTAELRELLRDDGKMERIIRLDEKFQELQLDRESLLTSNRSLAEESLARKPRLRTGTLQLAHSYRELARLAAACGDKQSRLEDGVQRRGLQTAQNLLQEEVTRAEEQSEELLERFMEGTVDLDRFLDSFQSSRKTYHVRRAQAEKLQEFIQSRRQGGGGGVPDPHKDSEQPQDPHRPNGFTAQGPLRVFQVRYGLTPAILLPHYPAAPPAPAPAPAPDPPPGHVPLPPHGRPVGLRVIGQLSGGWPAGGRPVRVQQLYRPQQPEPPYR